MSMENIAAVVMWAVFGSACAYFAKKQHRNIYLWFFIGLLLGIFGLLLLLMLPLMERFFNFKEKQSPTAREEGPQPTVEDRAPLSAHAEYKDLLWYYLSAEKEQVGPMSFDALQSRWSSKTITHSTYVWNEKLSNWKTCGELFGLQEER